MTPARHAADDLDLGIELARAQRDEDVLGLGVDAGDDRSGALDAGVDQQSIVRPGPAG